MAVRIEKSVVRKEVLKRLARIPAFTMLALFALYIVLTLSIARVVPAFSSGAGLVPVKDVITRGGVLTPGMQVLVNPTGKVDTTILGKLQAGFVPQTAPLMVVEVMAGPYGEMDWNPPHNLSLVERRESGVVVAPIKDTPFYPINGKSPLAYGKFLKNEYVGKCISGACEPGEGVIFHRLNTMGELLIRK